MRHGLRGWLLTAVVLLSPPLTADWAGFSKYAVLAELSLQAAEVSLSLRIPLKSLPGLAQRLGQNVDATSGDTARRLLQVLDNRGQALREGPLKVARDAMPDKAGVPLDYVEVTRVLSSDKPITSLTLVPTSGIEGQVGLVVLDRGVPLADLAPLTQTLRVRIEPDDPWKSAMDDPKLIRRHAQARSFLYVEPLELRHEVLLRLADLNRWLPGSFFQRKHLTEPDQAPAKEAIANLLKVHTKIFVEGREAVPESTQVQFVAFTRSGVQPLPPGPVDVKAAMVGIVMVTPADKSTASLSMTWDLFPADLENWPVSILDGQETFDAYVTPEQPRLDWSREDGFEPLTDPNGSSAESDPIVPVPAEGDTQPEPERRLTTLLALLLPVGAWYLWLLNPRRRYGDMALAGSLAIGIALSCYPGVQHARSVRTAAPDENRLRELLPPMLHNAYRGFHLRGEEAVYDRLAQSLAGTLLEETYLQQRRAVLRQDKGLGGLGNVDRVEIEHLQLLTEGDETVAEVEAAWVAHGTVSHWGHSHPRHNRYHARLTLQIKPDRRVRITAMEFLDGQTLGSGPTS